MIYFFCRIIFLIFTLFGYLLTETRDLQNQVCITLLNGTNESSTASDKQDHQSDLFIASSSVGSPSENLLQNNKNKRKKFLRLIASLCDKFFKHVIKDILEKEIVHLISQIPKIADKLIFKISSQTKDLVTNQDYTADFISLSEGVSRIVLEKKVILQLEYSTYLQKFIYLSTDLEKKNFIEKTIIDHEELFLCEIFLNLMNFSRYCLDLKKLK